VVDEATVHLYWATASETRNAGFEVQHAMEGDFVTRTFVDGHGTTARAQTYAHTASDLLAGTHRFRLRQVDVDGTASHSPVVEVNVASSASYQLSRPHPNPFHQTAALTLTVAQPQHVDVLLYDVLGRRVAVLHDGVIPAHRPVALQVDARSLSSGLYIVRVLAEQFVASRKMTLLR
jgi:predicted phage tail protein